MRFRRVLHGQEKRQETCGAANFFQNLPLRENFHVKTAEKLKEFLSSKRRKRKSLFPLFVRAALKFSKRTPYPLRRRGRRVGFQPRRDFPACIQRATTAAPIPGNQNGCQNHYGFAPAQWIQTLFLRVSKGCLVKLIAHFLPSFRQTLTLEAYECHMFFPTVAVANVIAFLNDSLWLDKVCYA